MMEIRQKRKVGLALCMVMLLTACGQHGGNVEPQGEITVIENLSESSEDSNDEIIVLPEQETAVVGGEADSGNAIAEADTKMRGCSDEIYQEIREYDFSVQEYPIDTTRYTADVEKEFLKAFHDVLTNRVPIEYWDSGEAYFYRDHLGRYFSYLSDKGFVELEEVFGDTADYTEESADEEEMLQVYQDDNRDCRKRRCLWQKGYGRLFCWCA